MTEPQGCPNHLSWDCHGFYCDLEAGHEGDHICTEEKAYVNRNDGRKGENKFREASFEIRWRERCPTD